MPLAIWPVDQNLKIFMNKPARGDTYCSPIGGSVLCASTLFPCHTESFPNILYIFIHCARYTMRDKRPFRLYCRRTTILREVSSDPSVSVRFLRRA